MSDFLPLMMDIHEKEIVIFGGGEVGERKASLFCDYAKVTVVSKDFSYGLNYLSKIKRVKLLQINDIVENDISSLLEPAFIVIPATNDADLNEKIANIAKDNGKFINRVDDIGDIIVPSVIRRNDIIISISSVGKSPGLSKYIRQRIEEVISPEFAHMSRLQHEIREILKTRVNDQKKRKEILWNILNDNDVWKAFEESYEKAYNISLKHIS